MTTSIAAGSSCIGITDREVAEAVRLSPVLFPSYRSNPDLGFGPENDRRAYCDSAAGGAFAVSFECQQACWM